MICCHANRSAPVKDTRVFCTNVKWDERYRAGDYPVEPHPLVVEAAAMLPPGRALDLACGAGRNARYLAGQGWKVTAIDASPVAVDIVRSFGIDARVLDLERQPLPFHDETFDLVCIINFLHRPLFAAAKRVTRPGGIVVASIRTAGSHSLSAEELRAYFDGWQLTRDLIAIKGNEA